MAVSAEQVRLILGTLILALMAAPLVVRRRLRLAAIAGSALVGASSVACLDHARAAQRYASYAEAGAGKSYDVAPVPLGDQAVAWQALDGEQSTVVAFVAGYTTPGYQWFRYPLFGRRLQNRVLYVSARADGRVPETWRTGGLDPTLDADAWGTRLRAEHVDWIMLAAPQPAEARLIYSRPDLFEPVMDSPRSVFMLVRLRGG